MVTKVKKVSILLFIMIVSVNFTLYGPQALAKEAMETNIEKTEITETEEAENELNETETRETAVDEHESTETEIDETEGREKDASEKEATEKEFTEMLEESNTEKDYLLYGYNALRGSYINTTNIGYKPILTSASKDAANPTSYSDIDFTYDSSIQKFYEKFTSKVNIGYNGVAFSGKARAEFNTTMNTTENRLYIRHTIYFYTKQYANNTAFGDLKQNLSDVFTKDVDELYKTDPQRIFSTYGTHLITQYYTGGRLDLNYTYKNKEKRSESDIIASVSASYNKVTGTASAADIKASELIEKNAELRIISTGGKTEAQISGTTLAEVKNGLAKWQKSIDEKPDICGVTEGSLYPIWELFSDKPEIRDALKNAYEEEQERIELGLKNMDKGPITDITAIYAKSYEAAEAMCPDGYYIVQVDNPSDNDRPNLDANHYGKGDFIFLAYTYKTVENEQKKKLNPIVDFIVAKGEDTTIANYHKVALDLNKGQGGPYLYLFYRRATDEEYQNKDTLYITAIKGYYGENYIVPANWYVNKNSLELNKGIKNRDGKDNYTNLMYQKDYRVFVPSDLLQDTYEEESIAAISELMYQEIPFDASKPLVESDEDVYEYEEGMDDQNPGGDSPDDGGSIPDGNDDGETGETDSQETNLDDSNVVTDDAEDGQKDEGSPVVQDDETNLSQDLSNDEESKKEDSLKDEPKEDVLLEGGLLIKEISSNESLSDDGQSVNEPAYKLPKTGNRSLISMLYLVIATIFAAIRIVDHKKRRIL